jgi:RNA polymerase sigma factor (TIGR02999 family)
MWYSQAQLGSVHMWPDAPEADQDRGRVTRLLQSAGDDDAGAQELLGLVYEQLRRIAQRRMKEEHSSHTLQATALVHEAYLRLVGDEGIQWHGRAHFFSAAAEAMRRILVEHARARGRVKRGGDGEGRAPRRVPLDVVDLARDADPDGILALDDAVRRLEVEEPDVAAVVRLRFFAGLSIDATAEALGSSPRTVDRLWAYARARLYRDLSGGG